jgi:hypothetical protein
LAGSNTNTEKQQVESNVIDQAKTTTENKT